MGTWVVTGANRGIGLEITRQALIAGHRVVAGARRPAAATALKELSRNGGLTILELDVADPTLVASFRKSVLDAPIDVLVNNAAVIGPPQQSVFDMDFEGFERTLAVNVLGPLRMTQALLPNLERAAAGKVIAVSSLMGSIGQGGAYQIAYSASKAALNRLMRGMASALKGKNVAVGIFSPGWVKTDMGGAGAELTVERSVSALMQRIEDLDLRSSGEFINWNGKPLPW